MADTWDSVSKDAMKILGDKGKIPKVSSEIPKITATRTKTWNEFDKSREDLKKKLLAAQTSEDATKDAFAQFQDEIDESSLGLDRKNKDDAKKIADAKKILSDYLQKNIDNLTDNYKNLRELDRHLMSIIDYKQDS